MDRIICVVGPTASGKTGLALDLAGQYDGEIVSCDSMQIYRGMDIGTAKPTAEERLAAVHHMIDVVRPDEDFSVGKYVEMADACVQDILSRGKTVIVTGGTGLYADSLISGRSFAPAGSEEIRLRLEREADLSGMDAMLERLRLVDPDSAARLHPSDRKRIIRALEVHEASGKTITQHNLETQQIPPRYSPVWIGLDFEDRADLYERIDRRVDMMLEQGLMDEIRALLDAGIPSSCTSMQAIGYKEFLLVRSGELTQAEAVALVKQRSRNYAKRQLTWFRRNPDIRWIRRTPSLSSDGLLRLAQELIPF